MMRAHPMAHNASEVVAVQTKPLYLLTGNKKNMIEQSAYTERNRVNALTPDKGLIDADLRLIRYMKSFANTPAKVAIWGVNAQVVYLDSNVETLATVEADKDKPAIVYSVEDYTLTSGETLKLKEICIDNGVDYIGGMQAIQALQNVGIAIIKNDLL